MSHRWSLLTIIAGCGILTGCIESVVGSRAVRPPCFDPAPLEGRRAATPVRYTVLLHDRVNTVEEVERLGVKYQFTAGPIWLSIHGFGIESVSDELVAHLRCEATVKLVEYAPIGYADTPIGARDGA